MYDCFVLQGFVDLQLCADHGRPVVDHTHVAVVLLMRAGFLLIDLFIQDRYLQVLVLALYLNGYQ